MKFQLFCQAVVKFAVGAAAVGLVLFGCAGTVHYPRGWRLMGILFVPMFAAGLVMLVKCPALLEKRLHAREQRSAQSLVIRLSGLLFIAAFAAAGFSYRFGFWQTPGWVSGAAAAVFVLAYLLYAEVLRENTWLSRTISVQEGQTLVDTGLYGIVRHPMYSVTVFLFLSMPLVLGSWLAFWILLGYPAVLVGRIRDEEAFLTDQLPGYPAYQKKVRWRLIPGIW